MIKIRKFKEEWVDGLKYKTIYGEKTYYEIFKNPTIDELKKANPYNPVRGVILKNGEFYIIAPSSEIVHSNIVEILINTDIIKNWMGGNWWRKKESLNEFLCIVQFENPTTFTISASYYSNEWIMDLEIFNQYKTNFEKQNPKYNLSKVHLK